MNRTRRRGAKRRRRERALIGRALPFVRKLLAWDGGEDTAPAFVQFVDLVIDRPGYQARITL